MFKNNFGQVWKGCSIFCIKLFTDHQIFYLIILFFIQVMLAKRDICLHFKLPKQISNALGDWLKILSIKRMEENHFENQFPFMVCTNKEQTNSNSATFGLDCRSPIAIACMCAKSILRFGFFLKIHSIWYIKLSIVKFLIIGSGKVFCILWPN
jgi:hypothetical protein